MIFSLPARREFCCLSMIFHAFVVHHLLTFFKIIVFKPFFQEHYQSVKQFGSVGPDLGPNCLQRLLADDKSCRKHWKS